MPNCRVHLSPPSGSYLRCKHRYYRNLPGPEAFHRSLPPHNVSHSVGRHIHGRVITSVAELLRPEFVSLGAYFRTRRRRSRNWSDLAERRQWSPPHKGSHLGPPPQRMPHQPSGAELANQSSLPSASYLPTNASRSPIAAWPGKTPPVLPATRGCLRRPRIGPKLGRNRSCRSEASIFRLLHCYTCGDRRRFLPSWTGRKGAAGFPDDVDAPRVVQGNAPGPVVTLSAELVGPERLADGGVLRGLCLCERAPTQLPGDIVILVPSN